MASDASSSPLSWSFREERMTEPLSRRSFFISAASAASAARVLGANDRVRLGIIGAYNRGRYLMQEANKCPNIEWVAVCDAWDERKDAAAELTGKTVAKYGEYRPLLDRKD